MLKKNMALCLSFIICIGVAAFGEEKFANRLISEIIIAEIRHSIMKDSLTPSPDSKRVAYVAATGKRGKQFVVVDGEEQRQYDKIRGTPIFSPDSKRLAYVAARGKKWFVVVDGDENQYDYITKGTQPIFSPNSRQVAYVAGTGNKYFVVVVDGKEGKQYDGIGVGTLIFSPDSNRLAYVAIMGNKYFVVVDGKEQKQYDGIMKGTLLFTPDGKRLVYMAQERDKLLTVLDEKEGKQYDRITFPGGRIIFDSFNRFHYLAAKFTEIYLVYETTD